MVILKHPVVKQCPVRWALFMLSKQKAAISSQGNIAMLHNENEMIARGENKMGRHGFSINIWKRRKGLALDDL